MFNHSLALSPPASAAAGSAPNRDRSPDADRRRSILSDENLWWLPKASIYDFFTSFTFLVMLTQCLIFLLTIATGGGFVLPGVNATFGPSKCALINFGAKFTPFIMHKSEYWRILTASFVHSGMITLIISLILEYLIVLPIEMEHGRAVAIFTFVISSATGYTFSCVASPVNVDTGALAAVMGFVGFRFAFDVLDWPSVITRGRRRIGALEAGAGIITLIVGQSPFVDNYCSFAGFVIGCFIGGAFFGKKVEGDTTTQKIVTAMAILAMLFVFFVCIFLIAAGRFAIIDNIIWSTFCVSNPFSNIGIVAF